MISYSMIGSVQMTLLDLKKAVLQNGVIIRKNKD